MATSLRAAMLGLALAVAASCSGGGAGQTGAGGRGGAAATGGGASGQAGAAGAATGIAGAGGSDSGTAGAAGHAGGGAVGSAGAGGALAGRGGTAGAGGIGGAAGGHTGAAGAGGIAACQSFSLQFEPQVPSVAILVHRASPESTSPTTGSFFAVRTALENAVSRYASEMRIGFTAYVGEHSVSACSLTATSVPIAADNAAAIAAQYDALAPVPPGEKPESPADAAIASVADTLIAEPGTGNKFLLFATNGNTDFCDDGNTLCATDAVTARLQTIFLSGIHTVVVALPNANASAVQNFANAGAGQPVALPSSVTDVAYIYDQCFGPGPWTTLGTGRGRTGTNPLATYATAGGSAPVYAPGSVAWPDLPTAVNAAFASMRSCRFTLRNGQIPPAKVAEGGVKIGGAVVPLDPVNGWSMPTPTVVQLNGLSCANWQAEPAQQVAFAFPCDAIQTN